MKLPRRIAVADVIPANEIVRGRGIVRVGRVLVPDIDAAERKGEIRQSNVRGLSIQGFVGRDEPILANDVTGPEVVIALLEVTG